MDGLVSTFVERTMDGCALAGIVFGRAANQGLRSGILTLGRSVSPLAPSIFRPLTQVSALASGFIAEASIFEMTPRGIRAALGTGDISLLHFFGAAGVGQGVVHSAVSLFSLKIAGIASAPFNSVAQNIFQSSAMVAGQHVSAQWGITDAHQEGLVGQWIDAQATVLHLWVGMRLLHQLGPNLFQWEQSKSLEIQTRIIDSRIPTDPLAWEGATSSRNHKSKIGSSLQNFSELFGHSILNEAEDGGKNGGGPIQDPMVDLIHVFLHSPRFNWNIQNELFHLAKAKKLSLDPLFQALDDPDPEVRQRAVSAISYLEHPDAYEPLNRLALSDSDPGVRFYAASRLERIDRTRALPTLIHLARLDQSPLVREEAVRQLGIINDPSSIKTIYEATADPFTMVKRKAKWAFEKFPQAVCDRALKIPALPADYPIEPLLEALGDSDPRVRKWAVPLLGKLKKQRAFDALTHIALHDLEPQLRQLAIIYLEGDEKSRQVATLTQLATYDDDAEVRAHAIIGFGDLRDPSNIPIVQKALEDRALKVRRAAEWALEEIGLHSTVTVTESIASPQNEEKGGASKNGNLAEDLIKDFLHRPQFNSKARHRIYELARQVHLPLAPLTKALEHPDPKVRRRTVDLIRYLNLTATSNTLHRLALSDEDAGVRRCITYCIREIDPARALGTLHHLAADSDAVTRAAAIRELGIIKDPFSIEIIHRATQDSSWIVKRAANWALNKFPQEIVQAQALKMSTDSPADLKQDPTKDKIKNHIEQIHDHIEQIKRSNGLNLKAQDRLIEMAKEGPEVVDLLVEALVQRTHDKKPLVRRRIAFVLAGLKDPRAFEPLNQLALSDPDPTVRSYVVVLLKKFGNSYAVPTWIRVASSDPHYRVRKDAIKELIYSHDASCIETLKQLLQHPTLAVKRAAREALRQFGIATPSPAQPGAILTNQRENLTAAELELQEPRKRNQIRIEEEPPPATRDQRKPVPALVKVGKTIGNEARVQLPPNKDRTEKMPIQRIPDQSAGATARLVANLKIKLEKLKIAGTRSWALQNAMIQIAQENPQVVGLLIEGLVDALNDRDPKIRQNVGFVLGRLNDPRAFETLRRLALEDPCPEMRRSVTLWLRRFVEWGAVDTFNHLVLHDSDQTVREYAIAALEEIKHPSSIEPLRKASEDPIESIGRKAKAALVQLRFLPSVEQESDNFEDPTVERVGPLEGPKLPIGEEAIGQEPLVQRSSFIESIDPSLTLYLREMDRYPLLSVEEEQALFHLCIEKGDKKAARQLANSNLRFVVKIAFEYWRKWKTAKSNLPDLIQEGNLGLMHAIKKYKLDKGARFTTYAVWWIRAYIIKYLLRNFHLVKMSSSPEEQRIFSKLGKEERRLQNEGIEPDAETVAEALGVKPESIEQMRPFLKGSLSLDTQRGEDQTLFDTLKAPNLSAEDETHQSQLRVQFEKFATTLDLRERDILYARFLLKNRTLEEIGDEYGVTRETIRQIGSKIERKLKKFFAKERVSEE
jgi:RNA polymerase sigma-32 factor